MLSPRPSLKTFEEFLTQMKNEDEATQRYFFKQILFAEKERSRLNEKAKKYYQRKKATQESSA
jgi:hypothetical protein